MIIKIEDLQHYKTQYNFGELLIAQDIKLHIPTGVFFSYNENAKTKDFLYFKIGCIDEDSSEKEVKSFDGFDTKSFFEAVDYFEKLIEQKQPQQKQEQPIYGYFYFVKNGVSYVVLEGDTNKIVIEKEDLEKIFTPPMKKPYGRLQPSAVDKEQYAMINSKFALDFDALKTEEAIASLSIIDKDVYAYKMIPYQNSDSEEPTPKGVNDDSLSLNDIEGEDDENMKGNDNAESDDQKSDNEDSNSKESKDSNEKDADVDQNNFDSDPEKNEKSDSDQDFENKDNSGNDSKATKSESSEDSQHQKYQDDDSMNNKSIGETKQDSYDDEEEMVYKKVGDFLNTDDLAYSYKSKLKVMTLLNTYLTDDFKPLIKSLNLNETTSKAELLVYITNKIDKFF